MNMKTSSSVFGKIAAAAVVLAAAGTASVAQARSDVYFSVGANVAPGVVIGASNYYPPVTYVQPAPVYVQPAPVYYESAPVYYGPRVYAAPAPVYYVRPGHRHHRGHWNERRHGGWR
jgi:hypothetical protein